MKDKNLNKENLEENLEDLERNEDLTSKGEDFADDDVVFEELNAEGDPVYAKASADKSSKIKKKFEDRVGRLTKERDEYLAGWQRIQADYKNREKEIEEYKKNLIKFANANLVKDILPVLDGYDMARANKESWESVDPNWRVGVEYLFSQLLKILENNNVQIFGSEGDDYNTSLHEAVETVEVEEKEKNDKIVSVLQKGYKIGEKILRPARVKVGHYEE
jgi:molecular chaperone GrpE (heat shock protein)